MSLESHSQFTPPLGLTIPRKQDVVAAVPSSRTLGTLLSDSDPNPVPDGTEVHLSGVTYVSNAGVWYDMVTFSDASSVAVTGSITLRNNGERDIGVTW